MIKRLQKTREIPSMPRASSEEINKASLHDEEHQNDTKVSKVSKHVAEYHKIGANWCKNIKNGEKHDQEHPKDSRDSKHDRSVQRSSLRSPVARFARL